MMRMGMALQQRQALSQSQRQATALIQGLKHAMLLTLHRELVGIFRPNEIGIPQATCPHCHYQLKDVEVMRGFLDDPTDTTTKCPKCHARFAAWLKIGGGVGSTVEVVFLCPEQTLAALQNHEHTSIEEFKGRYASIYYSAVNNFGGLKQAFRLIEIDYKEPPTPDWKEKVEPFLGKLPDGMIALVIGKSIDSIAKLRREKKIPAYKKVREEE